PPATPACCRRSSPPPPATTARGRPARATRRCAPTWPRTRSRHCSTAPTSSASSPPPTRDCPLRGPLWPAKWANSAGRWSDGDGRRVQLHREVLQPVDEVGAQAAGVTELLDARGAG